MSITSSRFFNNTSPTGGAVFAQALLQPANTKFIVNSSTFINNTAETDAGAIFVENHIFEIQNCYFESNRALSGNGGSLYFACTDVDYCKYDVYSNFFINNTADISGGSIKWTYIQPYNLTLNTYANNSAVYGNDIASYAISL